MEFRIVVPARYGSTRLPGKPLRQLGDKPLVQHVWERARRSAASEVIVATDDPRVEEAAAGFGAEVCMTAADHASGTDRICEVARQRGWPREAVVVNLQGDEPLMPAANLDQVAALLLENSAGMATLSAPLRDASELFDPNVVKVVSDARGYARYFSRAPVPWDRVHFGDGAAAAPSELHRRHIGLYAYRVGFLRRFVEWGPCALERMEALEQLRALWHGEEIRVADARAEAGPGVDTEEDLRRVEALLSAAGS